MVRTAWLAGLELPDQIDDVADRLARVMPGA